MGFFLIYLQEHFFSNPRIMAEVPQRETHVYSHIYLQKFLASDYGLRYILL